MEVAPPSEAVAVPSRHGETGPNPRARHRIVQHVRGSQGTGVGVQRMANRGGVTEICMPRPSAAARMRCGEMVRAAKMGGAPEMASAKVAAAEMSTAEMAAAEVAAAAVPTSTVPASTVPASTTTCETANRRRGRKRRRKQDNGNS